MKIAATYARIAAGSACGGLARWLAPALFPADMSELAVVLVVNVSGSLLIGALAALAERKRIGEPARELLMIGFCGGYTTFSAFSLVTLQTAQRGEIAQSALYVAVSLALWLGAVWLGYAIASAAVRRSSP